MRPGKGMRSDCDFSFAERINNIVDEERQSRIIDSIIKEIEEDVNEQSEAVHQDILDILIAAGVGIFFAILLITLALH
ncbi:MAG: hypothetical protein J6D36_01880 [Erysipelotrichaceae bacterium]|nr:hypothetical protein [Erysipelotrichaceae bacterium]